MKLKFSTQDIDAFLQGADKTLTPKDVEFLAWSYDSFPICLLNLQMGCCKALWRVCRWPVHHRRVQIPAGAPIYYYSRAERPLEVHETVCLSDVETLEK